MNQKSNHVYELDFAELPVIDFEANTGIVAVAPVPEGEQPRLEMRLENPDDANVGVSREGDTVRIRVDHNFGNWNFFGGRRDFRMLLYVPNHIHGRIVNNAGVIDAHDLSEVGLEMVNNAGQIKLSTIEGTLKLSSNAGQIVGRNCAGLFDMRSDAGEVKMYGLRLWPGNHRIHTSVGSVKLYLAPDQRVRIDAVATMGSVKIHYPSDVSAEAVLNVAAELGTVKVFPDRGVDGQDDERGERRERRSERHIFAERPMMPVPPDFGPFGRPGGPPPPERPTDEATRRVLDMVESGTVTAQEGMDLIRALKGQ